MSLTSIIRKALGFAPDSDDDMPESIVIASHYTSATPAPAEATTAGKEPSAADADDNPVMDPVPPIDGMLPGCIFDSVIRLFNRTMPDFVRQCIDTDSQRQYLFHAIESDVRRQIMRVAEDARRFGMSRATGSQPNATVPDDETRRELRRARATYSRQISALEARVADLEAMLQQANDKNITLEDEIKSLKRRLRKSKSKPDEEDGQPSLFTSL